ncbi:MAG TPA: MarR family winged helix-turn-helix transcriptional regulator [Jatrophihabitans sp.]|jgi:DNA-binding MarR family transcriptional regulator
MSPPQGPPASAAFLLTQVGTRAAQRFAERIGEHGLTPPQAGILGLLRSNPGISQQRLAEVLGMLPSRVVAFIDDLEAAGLVERTRDGADRRRNSLDLTAAGAAALRTIATAASAHDDETCRALDTSERAVLTELLTRIAADQGLTPGVHPGYRTLRPPAAR